MQLNFDLDSTGRRSSTDSEISDQRTSNTGFVPMPVTPARNNLKCASAPRQPFAPLLKRNSSGCIKLVKEAPAEVKVAPAKADELPTRRRHRAAWVVLFLALLVPIAHKRSGAAAPISASEPLRELHGLDGVSWLEVLETTLGGAPVIYRENTESKQLCAASTSKPKPKQMLVEYNGSPPALRSLVGALNATYSGVGANIHLNGKHAPADVPSMHLDLHPHTSWLIDAIGLHEMNIVCSCEGERRGAIMTQQATSEMRAREALLRTTTAILVPMASEAHVFETYDHWNMTLGEGDCVFFSSYTQFHKFEYDDDAAGQNHRLVPRGLPVWAWQKLFTVITTLARQTEPELDGREVYQLAGSDLYPKEVA